MSIRLVLESMENQCIALRSMVFNLENRLKEIEGHDEVDIKWVREVLNYEIEKAKKVLGD